MVMVLVALITSIPATAAAVLGWLNHGKVAKIEVNVNGKLSALLAENQALRTVITPDQAAEIPAAGLIEPVA